MDDTAREAVVVAGEFWLPSDPAERRTGLLTYGPGLRPRLEVIQGWQPAPSSQLGDQTYRHVDSHVPLRPAQDQHVYDRAVVHGVTVHLEAVSVLGSWDYPSTQQIGGPTGSIHKRRIEGTMTVIGAHVDSLEELRISKMLVEHSSLTSAVRRSGLSGLIRNERHADGEGFNIGWTEPEAMSVQLDDGTTVRCAVTGSMSPISTTDLENRIELTDRPTLLVAPLNPATFEAIWRDAVYPLGQLLNFTTGLAGGWTRVRFLPNGMDGKQRWPEVFHSETIGVTGSEIDRDVKPLFHLGCWDFHSTVTSWLDFQGRHQAELKTGLDARHETWTVEQIRLGAIALEGLHELGVDHAQPRFTGSEIALIEDALANAIGHSRVSGLLAETKRLTMQSKLDCLVTLVESMGIDVPEQLVESTRLIKKHRDRQSHGGGLRKPPDVYELRRAWTTAGALFDCVVLAQLDANVDGQPAAAIESRLAAAGSDIERFGHPEQLEEEE